MQQIRTPKTWFITGTSSGFGRTMTEMLLARGDRVVATVRTEGPDDLKSRYAEALTVVRLDVSDSAAVREVVDRAFAESGRIDVVVNNAGFGLFGAAEEVSDEQIRREIDTNLVGSIAVIRAALPHLRAQGGGRVIQVSSEGGQIAYPNFSLYHATKWGIEGFVESVALEVAAFGIEFTIAEPGPTKTGFRSGLVMAPAMTAYANTPSGEMRRARETGSTGAGAMILSGDPEKIARAMIDSVERTPAPKRLAFGAGTYARIRAALTARLADLDAGREIAFSTDAVT
ncbi:MAG: SDR family oxidoreductase [Candidatus Eremiobacteraeota bacterium]|nr:SDR family oxidoreductase [Candidatus Eremiobacteraeota bacterium]